MIEKFFKKPININTDYLIYTCFTLVFGFLFIHYYTNSQDFVNQPGTVWFYKYLKFSDELSVNFFDGLKSIIESVSYDTRNNLFVLPLYPFYCIFKNSYEGYILGNFLLYYFPSIMLLIFFINKYVFNHYKEFPTFRYIPFLTILTIPLFWWLVVTGYPEMLSLGIFICGLMLFFNYQMDNKFSFKTVVIISFLFYLSFLFRRWFIFAIISYLTASFVYFIFKNLYKLFYKKINLNEIKEKFIYIICNFSCLGLFFSFFIFVFQNEIFKQFFKSELYTVFSGYKLEPVLNWYLWKDNFENYITYIILFISLLFVIKNPRESKWIIFSFLNIVIYFLIFQNITTLYFDHFLYIILFLSILILVTLYKICLYIKNKGFQIIFLLFFLTTCALNFTNSDIVPITDKIKYIVAPEPVFSPIKIKNKEQIKQIEKELEQEIEKDELFTYSIWSFLENSFNYQFFFQNDYKKQDKNIIIPFVDTEALYFNWYFFPVINANVIWITEPSDFYLKEENSRILLKTTELLKNQKNFGKSYQLKEVIDLNDNYKALKYVRVKPLTKKEQEDYKNFILSLYPDADKSYPKKYDYLYKQNNELF